MHASTYLTIETMRPFLWTLIPFKVQKSLQPKVESRNKGLQHTRYDTDMRQSLKIEMVQYYITCYISELYSSVCNEDLQ